MQLAFIGHTMLGNQLSGHIGQKVGAVKHLALWNEADTAKNRTLFVMYASFEAGRIGVKMDADASWGQATRRTDADNACIAFDKGYFVQFSEIIHFCYQKFSEPRCDNAIAVVVVHFGGVEQGLRVGLVFGP